MLTNLKRNLGLLLAVATLSAVTALVPNTVSAAPSIVPNTGVGADVRLAPTAGPDAMDACPGTSAAAAGFTDTTSADVNCLAMFGITTGATATTYDPAGTIPRWQMALFIHRMFVPTGVAAAGLTAVPAFTDISGLSAEIQAAINALASHAITLGTTATTYSPDDTVTREQMAMFLNRFASIAKDHAGVAITAVAAATGNYNYTDITSATWEGMESIIRLYNLGVTDGTCTAQVRYVTDGTCLTTYRPNDNITRLEMAGMVHRLLNLTNARPAGLSMQSTTSTALVGAESPLISMRNADFSAQANTLVDEFYQVHNDAAGVAAQAPFNALSGVCAGTVAKTAGTTLCVVDQTDASTDARGNITGTSQTTTAYSTANWWIHTGATATQYVDGTTSGHYLYSIAHGAATAATVFANKTTYSSDAGYATVTSKAGETGVTGNDGITTLAGTSRTFTATQVLTTALTSTVVSGYTFKVATHMVDVNGNQTNSTAYYPSASGTASWTVTCSPDDSALTSTWWESYELTVTMAAADGGNGRPPTAGDPLATTTFGTGVGGNGSTLNVTCLDDARAYTGGTTAESLTISDNNYTISAAGVLGSVTATAYDQYGTGFAGATVRITSDTDGAGAAIKANLTTGANGTATLSAVVCPSGVETVAWAVADPGTATTEMDAITATVPSALAVEGTTMYCSTAATDGAFGDLTAVAEVQTAVLSSTAGGAALGGNIQYTYGGQTTAAIAFNADAAATGTAMDNLSTLEANAVEGAVTVTSADVQTIVFTFHTNWGNATAIGCVPGALTGDGAACAVTQGAQGVALTTIDFLDDNQTTGQILTKWTQVHAVGAASASQVSYVTYGWDSGDSFTVGAAAAGTAVIGGTETEFKTAMTAETGTGVEVKGSYRTGVLTTGVSAFQLG
jgi:hypothetical protein